MGCFNTASFDIFCLYCAVTSPMMLYQNSKFLIQISKIPSLQSKTPRLTVSNDAAFQISKTPPLYRKVVSTLNSKSPSKTPRLLPSLTGLQDCSPVFQDSSNRTFSTGPFPSLPRLLSQNLSTGSPESLH